MLYGLVRHILQVVCSKKIEERSVKKEESLDDLIIIKLYDKPIEQMGKFVVYVLSYTLVETN